MLQIIALSRKRAAAGYGSIADGEVADYLIAIADGECADARHGDTSCRSQRAAGYIDSAYRDKCAPSESIITS